MFLLLLPAGAHAAQITRQLDLGMSNADVTSLQTFLASDSSIYPSGTISGYFGSLTAAAVSRFQKANGLAAVGRVGPQTLALINSQMSGYSGGTGADVSAPIINPETVTMASTSATITWATSEAAHDRVMYGTTWPFLYATAPSVSGTSLSPTANITISGLQSHTTYYYVLESIDTSGNVMWTVGKPMTTL
jgi:peptidoglycan hydrolase-like protein with peptidoglycan-binding domain